MIFSQHNKAPKTELDLLSRCQQIEGVTFAQLAAFLGLSLPDNPNQRKGWLGQAVELFLGATAFNQSLPDFIDLGIELKTVPISSAGKPAESTFVATIPLLSIHQQQWKTSQCYQKLKRVLWLPIEGDIEIPFAHRRIGSAILWSPDWQQEKTLEDDWNFLTDLIVTGYLEQIDSTYGEYLQIRPKAANGKSLCDAFGESGRKIKTLPRGFYLRASFTEQLVRNH